MYHYHYSGVLYEYMVTRNNLRQTLADQRIKNFLLYKKKIHKDSICCKILSVMYPDVKLSIKQITSYIDKPYTYAKKIILQMHSDRYLYSNNNGKKYNRKYCLSPTGRWFAVCVQLDYIPFQSLLILSQIYCRARKNPKSSTNFYMISKFRGMFDRSCDQDMSCASAVYSNSNISKSIKQLTDRNLVYWANSDFLKISFTVFEFLQKYDDDLMSLVEWCNKTFEKCKDEYLESLEIGKKRKHLFELAVNS